MYRPLKLTRKTAAEIIGKVSTGLKVIGGEHGPDVYRYEAVCGLLLIRCENDWYDHNGRFKLTLSISEAGDPLTLYFYPETLERDYDTEQAERKKLRKEDRIHWAQLIGPELAHKAVNEYCSRA